jgi:hypothetical protein
LEKYVNLISTPRLAILSHPPSPKVRLDRVARWVDSTGEADETASQEEARPSRTVEEKILWRVRRLL